MVSFQINALRWGRVSQSGTYEIPEKTSSDNSVYPAGSRGDVQNDAGTIAKDWHKSGTVGSPNVPPISDWKNNRFHWLAAVRRDDRLSDAAQFLAVALTLDFAHHETAFCNPSIGRLSDHLRKCERTVQRAMLELRKKHWISVSQATGRGNKNSEITFLRGDGSVKIRGNSNVVNLSSGTAKSPTNSSNRQAESPTNFVSKADKFVRPPCTPYKDKPYQNHKAGGPDRESPERPYPRHVAAVPYGSYAENDWDAWLAKRGFPNLASLARKSSTAKGPGWDMPFGTPPSADDPITTGIAVKFADWAAYQKGFIQ
jgi:hypothetical protein